MSTPHPEHTAATWSSVFERKGGPGAHTRLWGDFPPATRQQSLERAGLYPGEIPVLAGLPPGGSGFILTSHRVIFFAGSRTVVVATGDVLRAEPAELHGNRGWRRLSPDWDTFQFTLRDGSEHFVKVEPGPPFIGVWNVLRNLMARNRRSEKG